MPSGRLEFGSPTYEVGSLATVSVQSGTAAPGYGPEFATDFSPANTGRPCLASGSNLSLELTFPSPQTLASMLIWHNGDDSSTVTVRGSTVTGSWGSAPFSVTIPTVAMRGDRRRIKLRIPLNQSYAHWLVVMPTNSEPPGMKIKCYSNVLKFAGLNVPGLGRQFQWDSSDSNIQLGIDLSTDFGYHWVYDYEVGPAAVSGVVGLTDADRDALFHLHQATGGRAPFMFVPYESANAAFLGRIALGPTPGASSTGPYTSTMTSKRSAVDYNLVTLTVEDITAGGPEWV